MEGFNWGRWILQCMYNLVFGATGTAAAHRKVIVELNSFPLDIKSYMAELFFFYYNTGCGIFTVTLKLAWHHVP